LEAFPLTKKSRKVRIGNYQIKDLMKSRSGVAHSTNQHQYSGLK